MDSLERNSRLEQDLVDASAATNQPWLDSRLDASDSKLSEILSMLQSPQLVKDSCMSISKLTPSTATPNPTTRAEVLFSGDEFGGTARELFPPTTSESEMGDIDLVDLCDSHSGRVASLGVLQPEVELGEEHNIDGLDALLDDSDGGPLSDGGLSEPVSAAPIATRKPDPQSIIRALK